MSVSMRVRVCVCVSEREREGEEEGEGEGEGEWARTRERERERKSETEREKERERASECVCVWERERQREREGGMSASHHGVTLWEPKRRKHAQAKQGRARTSRGITRTNKGFVVWLPGEWHSCCLYWQHSCVSLSVCAEDAHTTPLPPMSCAPDNASWAPTSLLISVVC